MKTEGDNTAYCETDWMVSFRSDHAGVLSGQILRIDRQQAVFEINGDSILLQVSEILRDFKAVMKHRTVYSGTALLTSVVSTGTTVTCEVSLADEWHATDRTASNTTGLMQDFFAHWDAHRRVQEPFKLAVADLQSFLIDLRRWLGQEELTIAILADDERKRAEREKLETILSGIAPTLDGLFEQFEASCQGVDPGAQVAHRVYLRRMLHPLLMACPFMHRIFYKPLGYAGDYEMMNMIWRNDFEGESMFAKLLNRYIVNQAPGVSVRKRVDQMGGILINEVARASALYGSARVFSVGCGPAREVQNFFVHPVSEKASFLLLDFNDETLKHTRSRIREAARRAGRIESVSYVHKSAHYLLKEDNQIPGPGGDGYDLIYSSGLYDYLNDRMCVALNTNLYEMLRPGGLLIVTNFTTANRIRNIMEFMFEWFLIHRDSHQMRAISPSQVDLEDCRVMMDPTGCNAFLEARKPNC